MNSQQVKDIKKYIDSMINKYNETGKLDSRYLGYKINEMVEIYESYNDLLNYFLENQKKLRGWYKCIDRYNEDYEYTIETDYGDYKADSYQQELLRELYDYDFWSPLH